MKKVLIALMFLAVPPMAFAEKIISKQDADHIFSLTRSGWEAYVKQITYPRGWKVGLSQHDTGTGIGAYDTATDFGLSIQPLYEDNDKPPIMLIVGNYYPLGILPDFTEDFRRQIEREAKNDLGAAYSVSARFSTTPSLEIIELTLIRTVEKQQD